MVEEWKKIVGFDNYEVSNLGNVRRLDSFVFQSGRYNHYKGRFLKQENVKGGYKRVTLCKNNSTKRFQVHRLVAITFIENFKNKPCVNHIDGDKSNNQISNLEWVTYSENERHSYNVLGKMNFNRKLSIENVSFIKNKCIMGKKSNVKEIAKKFNVNVSVIYNILKNKYYVGA
jgi:hypothetical protein